MGLHEPHSEETGPSEPEGPLGWRNWHLHSDGSVDPHRTWEIALHTDAEVIGEVLTELGPYQLLNNLTQTQSTPSSSPPPAMILRMIEYPSKDGFGGDWSKTKTETYHGGWIDEELASLVSLTLGIRCRSGGIIREFRSGGDPLGRPTGALTYPPYLPPGTERGSVLPHHRRVVDLSEIVPMLTLYSSLSHDRANVLVKSARLYQEAVWGADADPNSAWLLLISAIEAAAVSWTVGSKDRVEAEDPMDQLRTIEPKWADTLSLLPPTEASFMARELAPLVKATKRFLNFMLAHRPDPPVSRPVEALQLDWSKMKKYLGQIYKLRSLTLHEATPFPVPMMEPPFKHPEWPAPAEKPLGINTFALGGTWTKGYAPMTLATFEYIVRGTLINWWSSQTKRTSEELPKKG